MDCERALRELEAYLDGELGTPAQVEIERHLLGCTSCFDRGEFRLRVREIVRRKCGFEAALPDQVAVRIRRIISIEAEGRPGG
jgi:anti-sigma factor (TIGR02949 family)